MQPHAEACIVLPVPSDVEGLTQNDMGEAVILSANRRVESRIWVKEIIQ